MDVTQCFVKLTNPQNNILLIHLRSIFKKVKIKALTIAFNLEQNFGGVRSFSAGGVIHSSSQPEKRKLFLLKDLFLASNLRRWSFSVYEYDHLASKYCSKILLSLGVEKLSFTVRIRC